MYNVIGVATTQLPLAFNNGACVNMKRLANVGPVVVGVVPAGEIPTEIGALPKLSTLDLRFNQLSGPSIRCHDLELAHSVSSVPFLGHAGPSIHAVSVSVRMPSGSLPRELGKATSLTMLEVSENSLTGKCCGYCC